MRRQQDSQECSRVPERILTIMSGTSYTVELRPVIPGELARLDELARDLYFSWDHYTRGLFYYLDPELWDACRHNPKVFLRRISQRRLEEAATDRAFLEEYHRTLAHFDTYHREGRRLQERHGLGDGLVAYFCAEFGLHESLPIYSGGLGVLAGDYCKAASDIALPFAAVGLLYREGNLTHTIDDQGRQVTHVIAVDAEDLPVTLVTAPDNNALTVAVALPESEVLVRIWRARVGHTNLYLLDTDLEQNRAIDRSITHQLYPSDRDARIRQEIILGIGGVRALRRLGLNPTIWHINEGHPALLILERCRELVRDGMEFHAAVELVAASTVFTTHTPVTAGHDVFDPGLMRAYFAGMVRELGVGEQEFLGLGANEHSHGFNLTTFAIRCARFHNGVSRIHRRVAAAMERHIWKEIPDDESPIGYVGNGIHVPTFLARNWLSVLDDPGWHNELLNPEYWQRIDGIPDPTFWSVRHALKSALLKNCCRHTELRCRRYGYSEPQMKCMTERLRHGEDVMVIAVARRFATYKRATLLFDDPDRLARLLNDPRRPVLLIFAGKAHPHDEPGKELIRRLHEFSNQPRFLGKVVLLEGYDLALARSLVTGADLWVNVPEYPMEASGTSGMKAGINGVINLSVLDGWWADGFNGSNGWALQPHSSEQNGDVRRRLEAQELLDTLEYQCIPMYFDKSMGYSERWVKLAKESMKSIIPHFSAQRMVMDYLRKFYVPAAEKFQRLAENAAAGAAQLARWKQDVRRHWQGVSVRRLDQAPASLRQGEKLNIRVGVRLNGLNSGDVTVECLIGETAPGEAFRVTATHRLQPVAEENGETIFEAAFTPAPSGLVAYKVRAYPHHPLLCHRFDLGYLKWI